MIIAVCIGIVLGIAFVQLEGYLEPEDQEYI